MRRAAAVLGPLLGCLSSAAFAADCPKSLTTDQIVGNFSLTLVALKTPEERFMDVDTFYFFNGKCECSFAAPPRVKFYWREANLALRGPKGLKSLVAKMGKLNGQCPSVVNTWSHMIHCFRAGSPTCERAKRQ